MRRSSSDPAVAARRGPRRSEGAAANVLRIVRSGALDVLRAGGLGRHEVAADFGSAWSPLLRWVENPLRAPALATYTLAANAGVMDHDWRGESMALLRRSGEWHNVVAHPHVRPAVAFVKQAISEHDYHGARANTARSRGVEWFLLAQLACDRVPRRPGTLPYVITAPSQLGLAIGASRPEFCDSLRDVIRATPGDSIMPWQHVPLRGSPWAVSAVAVYIPVFEVTYLETIMQLLTLDEASLGARSALVGLGARRLVQDYTSAVHRGRESGMVVSLLRLHVEDIRSLVINEAVAPLTPDSPSWFCGLDRAVLRFCQSELLAWLDDGAWEPGTREKALTELLRSAQSQYMESIRKKFDDAGVIGGCDIVGLEAKLSVGVSSSFLRLMRRLRRKDPTQTLRSLLEDDIPWSYAEVFGVVQVDTQAIEYQVLAPKRDNGSSEGNTSGVDAGRSWMPGWINESLHSAVDELVRSEPRNLNGGVEPDEEVVISKMDDGCKTVLSNRADKLVWVESRRGGYWRCLLSWILYVDTTYEISTNESGLRLKLLDRTATHRRLVEVCSFREIHDWINGRLREDVIGIAQANQTMPGSWLDPEVRASLILLIAGARGLVHLGLFSMCLQPLIAAIRDIVYHRVDVDKGGDVFSSNSQKTENYSKHNSRKQQPFVAADARFSHWTQIGHLYLPAEIHCCHVVPPKRDRKTNSWIGVRWHEGSLLIASGVCKGNTLHATGTYVLANSGTLDLDTVDATGYFEADTWVIGAETPATVFVSPAGASPRTDLPFVQTGAHTLHMMVHATERLFRGAKIGVLWTQDAGVIPAIVVKGPLAILKQFAQWVPSIQIMGYAYSPAPRLANETDRQYFSSRKRAAKIWTQSDLRHLLAKRSESLHEELGVPQVPNSSYLAHAVADCVILFAHLKWALPVSPAGDGGWKMHRAVASSQPTGAPFQIQQRLMLPESTAMRVCNTDDVEILVDNENKLTLKNCDLESVTHPNNGLSEYVLQPKRGGTYERVATGTVEDAAFFGCGKRVLFEAPG